MTGLGFGFTNSVGIWGKWDMCLCFGCGSVGQGLGEWSGVMSVCVVSLDYLC